MYLETALSGVLLCATMRMMFVEALQGQNVSFVPVALQLCQITVVEDKVFRRKMPHG